MTDKRVIYKLADGTVDNDIIAVAFPDKLRIQFTRGFNIHDVELENQDTPDNFLGLTHNVSATEVKQELEVLRAREHLMREYPSRYYGEALDDVRDLLDRLIGKGE